MKVKEKGASAVTLILLSCLFIASAIVVVLLADWTGNPIIPENRTIRNNTQMDEIYQNNNGNNIYKEQGEISQCNDGLDNDEDGFTDFAEDRGCSSDLWDNERAECQNFEDDDHDGWIDSIDPGCSGGAQDDNEINDQLLTQCSDELDNDNDGLIDGQDADCLTPADTEEGSIITGMPQCSDGQDNDGDKFADYPLDPGCITLNDEDEQDNLAKTIGYAYAWSNKDTAAYSNLIPFYWLVSYQSNTLNINNIKAATASMPQGHKVIASWDLHRSMDENISDKCKDSNGQPTKYPCPWWNVGAAESAKIFDNLFSSYKSAGGEVDTFILDYEEICVVNWCLGTWGDFAALGNYSAIQNDSRFVQAAAQLGFSNLTWVWDWGGYGGFKQPKLAEPYYYVVWNRYVNHLATQYINQGTYNVIKKYYPQVTASDWQYRYQDPKYKLTDYGGHPISYCGGNLYCSNGDHVGTHQSPAVAFGGLQDITKYIKIEGINSYPITPFNSFRFDINELKVAKLSSNVPLRPWVAARGWSGDGFGNAIRNTDVYQEIVLHTKLIGVDDIIYWNPRNFYPGGSENGIDYTIDNKILSDTLKEFDQIAGFQNTQTLVKDSGNTNVYEINELAPWADDYVLTGANSGGRRVWRFTPNLDSFSQQQINSGQAINSMIISETNQTVIVKTNTRTLTFADSAIWHPTNPASHNGLWIVQAQNAQLPIII